MDVNFWKTEDMELGPYAVVFEISAEDSRNFYEGNEITLYWQATKSDGKFGQGACKRKVRYSGRNGKYVNWNGYAICYEDFDFGSGGSIYHLVTGN